METLSIIMFILFVAIFSYIIGVRRGFKCYEHDYDEGYLKGYEDALNPEKEEMTREEREENLRILIGELDEVFEANKDLFEEGEEEDIIDSREY